MGKRITDRAFFEQPAKDLAIALLGKVLCHKEHCDKELCDKNKDFIIKCRITTTEAYLADDLSLDANRSKKETSQYLAGGHLHIHLVGDSTRSRFDIVANQQGVAESVLIAATDVYDGPCLSLWGLDIGYKEYDGVDLVNSDEVWLECDGAVVVSHKTEKRKNIQDDGELRFSVKELRYK